MTEMQCTGQKKGKQNQQHTRVALQVAKVRNQLQQKAAQVVHGGQHPDTDRLWHRVRQLHGELVEERAGAVHQEGANDAQDEDGPVAVLCCGCASAQVYVYMKRARAVLWKMRKKRARCATVSAWG